MTTFEWLSILVSTAASTWYISMRLQRYMTIERCREKRRNCPCIKRLRGLTRVTRRLERDHFRKD